MVRKGHVRQRRDHKRVRDRVAEAKSGHGPGLGERAHDDQSGLGVEQVECRPWRELRVGLVDNEDPWDEGEHGTDAVARLEAACRVVRRAEEGDRRAGRSVHAGRGCDRSFNFGRIHDERVVALAGDKGRAGEQGDVGVKRVRRLEHRRGPAGAAVGEQDALDHLVRAVGAEHLCRLNAVVGGQRLAERGRFPGRDSGAGRRVATRRPAPRPEHPEEARGTRWCSASPRPRPAASGIRAAARPRGAHRGPPNRSFR